MSVDLRPLVPGLVDFDASILLRRFQCTTIQQPDPEEPPPEEEEEGGLLDDLKDILGL